MQQYLTLFRRILDEGTPRGDRTGTGIRSVFGHPLRIDLAEGFPALTTTRLHLRSIIHERLWFLRGETHEKPIQDAGVRI